MDRIRRAALPRLEMSPQWDELRLNGRLVHSVRPRSRCWHALEALMRKAPLPVATEELFGICVTANTADPKGAVHNVVHRLRASLERGCGFPTLVTCPHGGWRLLAHCKVLESGAPLAGSASSNTELALGER